MTQTKHPSDQTCRVGPAQDSDEKEKSQRAQSGSLANQNVTRPAPINRPNDDRKAPVRDGLENRNITKPGALD